MGPAASPHLTFFCLNALILINLMEDAIRLNASGLALSIFVGAEYEKWTLVSLSNLIDEEKKTGFPSWPSQPSASK